MIRGSCLCGGVAFEVSTNLGMITHCHCSICRKIRGTAFATDGVVAADAFRWLAGDELIRRYEVPGGGVRPFCARCGSTVPSDHLADVFVVPLGAIEGDPGARPLAHIFVGSKAPWHEIADDLPRFDAFPPGFDAVALPDPVPDAPPSGWIAGGCVCRGVGYRIEGTIDQIRYCHCTRCRRARGAAHASNGFVDPARFRLTYGEELVESFKVPDAERFTQSFCRTCGSTVPKAIPNRPFVVIPMGSVDGDPGGRPSCHIFVGSKSSWYEIADSLPQHAEYPPP